MLDPDTLNDMADSDHGNPFKTLKFMDASVIGKIYFGHTKQKHGVKNSARDYWRLCYHSHSHTPLFLASSAQLSAVLNLFCLALIITETKSEEYYKRADFNITGLPRFPPSKSPM